MVFEHQHHEMVDAGYSRGRVGICRGRNGLFVAAGPVSCVTSWHKQSWRWWVYELSKDLNHVWRSVGAIAFILGRSQDKRAKICGIKFTRMRTVAFGEALSVGTRLPFSRTTSLTASLPSLSSGWIKRRELHLS